MKIVLGSFRYEPNAGGGAVAVLRVLANELLRAGDEVVVVTTHPQKQIQVDWEQGVKIYRLPPRNLYWVGLKNEQPLWKRSFWQLVDTWNPGLYLSFRRLFREEKPDIIHIHKMRGLSPSIWSAAAAEGIGSLVHTCHDYELISPQGVLTGRFDRWVQSKAWFLRPYISLRSRLSTHVAVATAPSQFTLDLHTRHHFFAPAAKKIVPNSHGFSECELDALRTSLRERDGSGHHDRLQLLYLGRLEQNKGVELLCKVFQEIHAEFPEIVLHIAGDGPLEYSLRGTYQSNHQIRFHGLVTGERKQRLLRTCDVLVVPSIGPEVFGIVIAEAFAYGKPVIATRSGGIPELISENKTGFLIPPAQPDALREILISVFKHRSQLKEMEADCFQAATAFPLERIFHGYRSIYRELTV